MKNLLMMSVAAVAAGSLSADGLKEISFMTAMPAETAPVIDGELTDACWAKGVPNKIY